MIEMLHPSTHEPAPRCVSVSKCRLRRLLVVVLAPFVRFVHMRAIGRALLGGHHGLARPAPPRRDDASDG